ncbi:hypothetical protein EBR43_04135 [bacterium]|nr:hypothetical protein [bacterium]NBW56968.1 hypothetical protein [bacterium]NBX71491.1 hypothetical protein [bacterium]
MIWVLIKSTDLRCDDIKTVATSECTYSVTHGFSLDQAIAGKKRSIIFIISRQNVVLEKMLNIDKIKHRILIKTCNPKLRMSKYPNDIFIIKTAT